jgi:hypothetical protein
MGLPVAGRAWVLYFAAVEFQTLIHKRRTKTRKEIIFPYEN